MIKKECYLCNKEFDAVKTSYKFCSNSCSATYNNKHRVRKTKISKICPSCENPYYKPYSKYCSNECYLIGKHALLDKAISLGLSKSNKSLRGYFKRHGQDFCTMCNITTWLDKPIILEIDHIDGNPHNNSLDNIRLLCPNCHSQTPTYKGLNKGNGRVFRRKKL